MTSEKYYNLGILELMELLHLLHKSGYQKLRWLSYVSPNGAALRCHITTQDNIWCNRDIMSFDDSCLLAVSTDLFESKSEVKPLIAEFIRDYCSLAERGRGTDEDYARWFEDILRKVKRKKVVPAFYGEWFSAPIGHIILGDKVIRTPPMRLRLISWNIDGLKARFDSLIQLQRTYDPDIICLQKVKDSKKSKELELPGYDRFTSEAPYAGVATYVKSYLGGQSDTAPQDESTAGHFLRTVFRYPKFTLFNVYVPYANSTVEGAVEYRQFFDRFLTKAVSLHQDRVIVCGDMNIVHDEKDCWNGEYKRNQANFSEWERENFERLLRCGGMVDTFRAMHPFSREFSYFFRNDPKVRKKNEGHRIDYILASESIVPEIIQAEILKDFTVSTNNPVLMEFRY